MGANYQTFASWIQKRRHARGLYPALSNDAAALVRSTDSTPKSRPQPLPLMEAVMASAPIVPQAPPQPLIQGLEIILPGGAKLIIIDAHHITLVAQLLNALRTPC